MVSFKHVLPSTSFCSRICLRRFASNNSQIKEIGKLASKSEEPYETGQAFIHKVFGYRGLVLFSWTCKVHDRGQPAPKDRTNVRSEKFNFSGLEVPAIYTNYYQVLMHRSDYDFVNMSTEMYCFTSPSSITRRPPPVKGVDHVSHEDVVPYLSCEQIPVDHESFGTFFKSSGTVYSTPKGENSFIWEPTDYLSQWKEKNLAFLEQTSVHIDVTEQVRVTVIPFYMGIQPADSGSSHYWWRYTVRIENLSADQTVTLRERHWKIYSTGNKMQEVKGKGVIGYEPCLSLASPAFQYNSYTQLASPSGHMWGTYTMERQDGSTFQCRIPPMSLESSPIDRTIPPVINI